MADKGKKIGGLVIKKSTVPFEYPPIPLGKAWRLVDCMIGDVNVGDNLSSVIRIQFGPLGGPFSMIRSMPVTGSTICCPLNEDLIGDGVRLVRVERQNTSNSDKEIMFHLNMIELDS